MSGAGKRLLGAALACLLLAGCGQTQVAWSPSQAYRHRVSTHLTLGGAGYVLYQYDDGRGSRWIDVTRAGSSDVLQRLPCPNGSAAAADLLVEDLNFDGAPDLRLWRSHGQDRDGDWEENYYDCWLWDPAGCRYEADGVLGGLCNPRFDAETRRVYDLRLGWDLHQRSVYEFQEGRLVCLARFAWEEDGYAYYENGVPVRRWTWGGTPWDELLAEMPPYYERTRPREPPLLTTVERQIGDCRVRLDAYPLDRPDGEGNQLELRGQVRDGAGNLLQTFTALGGGGLTWLEAVDANFDGYADFSYMDALGAANLYLSFWLWDPDSGRFVPCPELEGLSNVSFDRERQPVTSHVHRGASSFTDGVYCWRDGDLVCLRRLEMDPPDPDTGLQAMTVTDWGEDGRERVVYRAQGRPDQATGSAYRDFFRYFDHFDPDAGPGGG